MTHTDPSIEELLRRYVDGSLTAPQEAELERRARTDEGLREALDALMQQPEADHAARIAAMIGRSRPVAARRSLFRRYAAAATVLVLLGVAALLLPRYFAEAEAPIAMDLEGVASEPATVQPAEPVKPATTDRATQEMAPATPPTSVDNDVAIPSAKQSPSLPAPAAAPPPPLAQAQNRIEVATEEEAAEITPTVRRSAAPAAAAAPLRRAAPSKLDRVAPAPPPPVRGRVTTEDGRPLANAAVTRPGIPLVERTDSNGNFALAYDATLREFTVSHPEYEDAEIDLVDPAELLQVSLREVAQTRARPSFFDGAARQELTIDEERGRARPTGGYRQLRERIEANKPDGVPPGRVRVSFLVAPDGSLSDFQFRGQPDRATMDYVGTALVESSTWKVVNATTGADGGEKAVRVYLKLRF